MHPHSNRILLTQQDATPIPAKELPFKTRLLCVAIHASAQSISLATSPFQQKSQHTTALETYAPMNFSQSIA